MMRKGCASHGREATHHFVIGALVRRGLPEPRLDGFAEFAEEGLAEFTQLQIINGPGAAA